MATKAMRVHVRLFASYREIVGARELAWTLGEGARLGQLVDAVLSKYPRLEDHREAMVLAVNHSVAPSDIVLRDGDEVALLPPVSGGGG
jgi:molybdopterin converting factor subunit 1